MRRIENILSILTIALLFSLQSKAQCPEVFDFNGVPTANNPYWYSCTGSNFSFNLQSPDNWGAYTVDWGDGSPMASGASWTSPGVLNHVYTAAVDTFVVVITETSSGCLIQGVVVMEEATSASIQIPVGGLTQACAPQEMEFINSSTNVSETTTFVWDFGDGSDPLVFDHTNWNQTIAHTYEKYTVDCETEVSLTASNYCNVIQGGDSEATFNPIRIWDVDDAAISPSASILCYPDTTVTFLNSTERNCLFQGNIYQRYEYWNFGDYWGNGYDSIIDWTPWPPTFPHTMSYPGIGTYDVMLLDSNYCGIDTAVISISIVPPPTADISVSNDTVCVGAPVTFFQNASGGADTYSWNFDDGPGWLPTGGGNITYVYNTPGTYTVCSAVSLQSSSSGCADTACVDVTILASPVADITFDQLSGCDSLTVDFGDASIGAVQWDWTFDVPPTTFSGQDPAPVHYDAPGNYVVTLTVESLNGCIDTDQELVEVFESPVVDFLADNVCEGEEAQFVDLSTFDPGDPIISWNWNFGDGQTSNLQSPTNTFNGTGVFNVTLDILTATCSGTGNMDVSVDAAPIPSFTATPVDGCSPLSVQFTNTSIGASNYTWDFGDLSGSAVTNPEHTFINYTTADTTFNVVMTANTTFGCSANDSLEITVFPGAIASFTHNGNPPGCAPFEAEFTNNSLNAVSYFWDLGDGYTTTDENPAYLYNNTTGVMQTWDAQLIAYAANGCHDTTINPITIFPIADFSFTLDEGAGCSPFTVTMPYISGVLNFGWDFGDGTVSNFPNPTHVYTNNSDVTENYTITLIGASAFGCIDTASYDVSVDPQPSSQFSADTYSGCSPLNVNFSNLSMQSTSYQWDFGDGTYSTSDSLNVPHTFTNISGAVVVYNVTLYAYSGNGCEEAYTTQIEVFPQPVAGINSPPPGCSPHQITFSDMSYLGSTYDWDLGNGLVSNLQNPTTTYLNTGITDTTYTVTLITTSTYGCVDSTSSEVIVYPLPTASFTMDQLNGCDPVPVEFTNNSTLATSFNWDYGDGYTSNNADSVHVHLFSENAFDPLNFDISMTAVTDHGCTASFDQVFTMYPPVVAAFVNLEEGCSPLQVNFSNQSFGADQGYTWQFGDGQITSIEDPVHTFVNNLPVDTTYTINLTAQNIYGCIDTAVGNVTVYPSPIAIAQIDTVQGCYPLEVTFENASIGGDTFEWVYGTGAVAEVNDQFHNYTYYNLDDEPVTYNIVLNAYSIYGCQSSDLLSIEVQPELQAAIQGPTEACSPFEATFINNSNGAMSYEWYFGDGGTSFDENPTHIYLNDTGEDIEYTVAMQAASYAGCEQWAEWTVTVLATPDAAFSVTPTTQIYPNATISITDESIAGDVNYQWNMGDGTEYNFENIPDHTYDNFGDYEVKLILNNGSCADTAIEYVNIIAPPPTAFFDMQMEGCRPLTVNFQSNSSFAATYHWDFGDGGQATVSDPTYTYYQPGTYTVTLTVTGFGPGQFDTYVIEDAIEVFPFAIAAFAVTPDEVVVPQQAVQLLNLSDFATNYFWDFGDGTSSTLENPQHYYESEGLYDITLIAYNQFGCPDTFHIPGAVYAKDEGNIIFPNAFTPSTSGGNGGEYDYTDFSNNIFFPIQSGVVDYELQIFNKWGELLFETDQLGIGWDGYYRGELCKQDVYAWKVRARFNDGEEIVEAGDVTLLIK